MPEPSSGLWQYLKDYGVVEAILAIFTILLGVAAIFRGNTDKRSIGPLNVPINGGFNQYENLQILRELNEEGRSRNRILERIENKLNAQSDAVNYLKSIEQILKERLEQERYQTGLLEDIRNNQVLRGDIPLRRR